jgi:WD40 repeat protein
MFAAKSVVDHPSAPYFVSAGGDNSAKIWSLSSVDEVPVATCETSLTCPSSINCVAFNPNGENLVTGCNDAFIGIFKLDWFTMKVAFIAPLLGHTSPILSLAFNPVGDIIASGSHDGTIKMWDVKTSKCVNTLDGCGGAVNSIKFHQTALPAVLATGHNDNTTKLWLLSDKSSVNCIATLAGHTGPVLSVAFHPHGDILATGSQDHTVRLWHLSANKLSATCVAILTGHKGPVNSVQFNQTNTFLVTGSNDGTVRVYNI